MNTIYFVSDGLEKYGAYLKEAGREFNFISFGLDDMLAYRKNSRGESFLDNDLVIVSTDVIDERFGSITVSELRKKTGIPFPHFLFISKTIKDENENENIEIVFDKDDFFYLLSDDEIISDSLAINHFYILLLFKCIENRKRVHDYIVCSFGTIVESAIINRQKREIERLYGELKEMSRIDSLTGVLNRRAFFDSLDIEWKRALTELRRLHTIEEDSGKALSKDAGFARITAYYGHLSCIMIDIDDFKTINDRYGHAMGDQVLQSFGKMLKANLYESDIIGRYGGEEFIALLPETSSTNAKIPAERLRQHVKETEYRCHDATFGITVSVGISDFHANDKRYEDIVNRADKALYTAKQMGKDRIQVFEMMDSSSTP